MSLKSIAETVGFNLEDESKFDLNEFKTHLDTNYILRDNVLKDEDLKKKVTGNIFGKLNTKAAQTFGLTSGEVKEKSMEEIFEAVKSKYEAQIAEAKSAAGGSDDERVKALEKKLKAKEDEYEQVKGGLTEWETKYNTDTTELKTKAKNTQLNYKLNEAFSKVGFIDEYNTDEIRQAGFKAVVNAKYKIDLDEESGNIIVTDKDGKHIKHPTKTGAFADFKTVLEIEAEAAKLLKKNNGKGDAPVRKTQIVEQTPQTPVRKIHPNAVKAAGV
jgi:hypothetical protein